LDGVAIASLDAFMSSGPLLHGLASIDWDVLDGVRISAARSLDLDQWTDIRRYVQDHYFDLDEPTGFFRRLTGYVGESKAGGILADTGHIVEFPDTPNNPGYDLTVDGDPLQVKVGGTAQTFSEHFEKYPGIPVITGTDNIDNVAEGADVLFVEELEANAIREATGETLDIVHEDMHTGGPTIPYVTAIVAGLREIGLLLEGHTDIKTAGKHIALDTAGVGLGGWAGAKVGATIGGFLGPVGMALGSVAGAIGGAVFGRGFINEIKYTAFREAVEKCQRVVETAQEAAKAKEREAHNHLASKVDIEEQALSVYSIKVQIAVGQKLREYESQCLSQCVSFTHRFPDILKGTAESLKGQRQTELAALRRSNPIRRLVWPAPRDVRYGLIRREFRNKARAIARARSRFGRLASRTPDSIRPFAAVNQIVEFIQCRPFLSPDLDVACHRVVNAVETAQRKSRKIVKQAEELARREYAVRVASIQTCVATVSKDVSDCISIHAAKVSAAKKLVEREARKLGIDLDSQGDEP